MKKQQPMAKAASRVYVLRHLTTGEYVCLHHGETPYLSCFSDGDGAYQFQSDLCLAEFTDVQTLRLADAPFDHFYLDGQRISRAVLASAAVRQSRQR